MERQPLSADISNLRLRQRQLDRRRFLARATSLGLTAGAAPVLGRTTTVLAQRASPAANPGASPIASPASTGRALTSMTRDEYWAAARAAFPLETPAATGGVVIYGETSDLQVLNPNLAADVYSALVTGLVFDGLVTISALDGTPAPGLADFWERSDDGLIYTFHLNQNATWHDGQPVTAADVVFSFESILAAESLSPRKSTVEAYLAEVRAIDDHTVVLRASDRYATFIENTASLVAVLSCHIC